MVRGDQFGMRERLLAFRRVFLVADVLFSDSLSI
jgi:hypothetical protein